MPSEQPEIDHSLTFAQREGAAALPRQLALGELTKELRSLLWALVYSHFQSDRDHHWISGNWNEILKSYWIRGLYREIDLYENENDSLVKWVKPIIVSHNYTDCLTFIEFIVRHRACPRDFVSSVDAALINTRAAYRLFGKSIAPISSPEEGAAIADALKAVDASPYVGAKRHLQNAASTLTGGSYADSIRESVHAVESIARLLDPNATTLAPALNALEKQGHLHPALRKAFQSLYGWTSDQQGIRHSLLEAGDAKVTEADALFMFGSCASFVAYLVRSIAR